MSTTQTDQAPTGPTNDATIERAFGLLLVVVAIAAMVHLARLELPELPGDPGPRLFPGIAAGGLGLCGALLLLFPPRTSPAPLGPHRRLGVFFLLALVGYIALMQVVGYYVSTPVFIVSAFLLLSEPGHRRPIPAAITAVVVTVTVALIFGSGLDIVMPEGML